MRNVSAARQLRRTPTRSESLLWAQLRDRRLSGLKFRRQHPVGGFVLDFYCEQLRLAVEVDGSIHSTSEVALGDVQRQATLEELGIGFVRLPAELVEQDIDAAAALITCAVASISGDPTGILSPNVHDSPLPQRPERGQG